MCRVAYNAAATVQIQVLDHLIVSTDTVFSFRQEGLL
jgi:DNA repair protein RadC